MVESRYRVSSIRGIQLLHVLVHVILVHDLLDQRFVCVRACLIACLVGLINAMVESVCLCVHFWLKFS